MSLSKFIEAPFSTSHKAYAGAAIAIAPAPEYANSEVLLSSLYRVLGLGIAESKVADAAEKLEKAVSKARKTKVWPEGNVLAPDEFDLLLRSVLDGPKLANQSAKRALQVTPLVPLGATFSGSARLRGNPWTPGVLVRNMISLGARDTAHAATSWEGLFASLSVGEDDDVFAQFVQGELHTWIPDGSWVPSDAPFAPAFNQEDRQHAMFPAARFVEDLPSIIAAKPHLTRRQWTSVLEAVVRLACVSHVAWLCEAQAGAWAVVNRALAGGSCPSVAEARRELFPPHFTYLTFGDRALPALKDRIYRYLSARLGLNAILWALDELDPAGEHDLSSASGLRDLGERVASNRQGLLDLGIAGVLHDLVDQESRTLLCKKGTGVNMFEFARHALGQRQVANPSMRGYDQGYFLRKGGTSKGSPWVVGLGPVATLALVHCALAGAAGPRSVHRLAQHLQAYGIAIDHRDIATNDLGVQLRMLGLVIDSPDAESGMLLVSPFGTSAAKEPAQ